MRIRPKSDNKDAHIVHCVLWCLCTTDSHLLRSRRSDCTALIFLVKKTISAGRAKKCPQCEQCEQCGQQLIAHRMQCRLIMLSHATGSSLKLDRTKRRMGAHWSAGAGFKAQKRMGATCNAWARTSANGHVRSSL